jgi:hypothetical protein
LFFIELVEILKQDSSKAYPCFSFEKGQAPQQVFMDDEMFDDSPPDEE